MLTVHRGSRADLLIAELAGVLATPASSDVFTPEWIAVHSRGLERWISQQLSRHLGCGPTGGDGVAATIEFPFPQTVVSRTLAAVTPPRSGELAPLAPDEDPWRAQRLAWTLLDLVASGALDTADLGAFGVHVAGSRLRRLPAMRHAAGLLDRYQEHRPDMVTDWVGWDGDGPLPDGRGGSVPERMWWQAKMLLAARARLGPTRAEQVAAATSILAAGSGPLDGLPPRISLFAMTAMAASHFRVIDALAGRHDVHLFLLHPSPKNWEKTATQWFASGPQESRPARADVPLEEAGHPLVTRWGQDSRELQVLLANRGQDHPLDTGAAAPTTLLERLQADIRADRDPTTSAWTLAPDDLSVQVHAAHGRYRQVEVARDAILAAMAADPSLEPRDIVVMTPDVETFAPLVDAAFDNQRAGATGDGSTPLPRLRVRLADRALRQTNPLLATVADLLDLLDSRFEAGAVIELFRREPVRRRFGLTETDVETVLSWLDLAGIRWGLDGEHRARIGIASDINTWRFGLDRLLAGVAVRDGGLLADRVVAVEATSSNVALVGSLAEFLSRLEHLARAMLSPDGDVAGGSDGGAVAGGSAGAVAGGAHGGGVAFDPGHSPARWVQLLRDAADLLTLGDVDDAWQRWQFDQLLDDLSSSGGCTPVTVTLPEVRSWLAPGLAGRPSRANHQTGDLTVCTLVPMRTVPFRLVVLMGLDDGSYPRRPTLSGDDITGLTPLVGDREPRTEDRQLLLDAVMSATDGLIVTHRGANESTNQPVPPSIVVAELLDALDATAATATGEPARSRLWLRHTLRAADPANFDERARLRGFDEVALAGARAAARPPKLTVPVAFDPPEHVPVPPGVLSIRELADILANPARAYVRHALGFSFAREAETRDDNLVVELKGLDRWAVGQALLDGLCDGEPPRDIVLRLRRRGVLPVGHLADRAVAELHLAAATIAAVANDLAGPTLVRPDRVEVDLDLGTAQLRGSVVLARQDHVAGVTFSSAKPGQLLGSWIQLLAANAAGRPVRMVRVAKYPTNAKTLCATSHVAEPVAADQAVALLADLVEVARFAQVTPIPFFANTSGAWWLKFVGVLGEPTTTRAALAAAMKACMHSWSGGYPVSWGECSSAEVIHLFGAAPLSDLLDVGETPPRPPSWWPDEPHQFARWARWVYEPITTRVQSSDHPPLGNLVPLEVPS